MIAMAAPDLRAQVSSCLFYPRDLTVSFLVAMSVLFVGGVAGAIAGHIRFTSALELAEADYRSARGNAHAHDPKTWLGFRAPPESTLRWVDPIPSFLVTIGILGTFIGLGVAVSESIPLLKDSSDGGQVREALTTLLELISFKFQSSAWGVILSLTFTAAVRLPLETSLARQTDACAVRLSVLRTLPEDRVVTAIGALKSLLESNVRSMDDCAQTLANSATKLAESVGALERKVGESATRLGSAAGKLEHLGKDVDASLGRVAQTIGDRLAEANHDFKKVAEDQAGALKTQLTEIAGAITIAIASQNSSAEKLSKDIESALGKIGKALSGSLGHMETALGANLSAMNNEIAGAMRSQKEATKENDEKLREFLGTLRKTVEVLNENTKEALAQLNGYQAKSTGALEGLDTQLNLFAQQQAKLLDLIGRWEAMTGKAALEAARPRGEVIGAAAPPAEASTSPKRGPRGSGGAGPNDGFV